MKKTSSRAGPGTNNLGMYSSNSIAIAAGLGAVSNASSSPGAVVAGVSNA